MLALGTCNRSDPMPTIEREANKRTPRRCGFDPSVGLPHTHMLVQCLDDVAHTLHPPLLHLHGKVHGGGRQKQRVARSVRVPNCVVWGCMLVLCQLPGCVMRTPLWRVVLQFACLRLRTPLCGVYVRIVRFTCLRVRQNTHHLFPRVCVSGGHVSARLSYWQTDGSV